MGDRFVTLALATVRSAWSSEIARWATVGSIPVELVKCVSGEEVRARLLSGRPFSALLLDAEVNAADRDLIDLARAHGCTPIVVDHRADGHDWLSLGAAVALRAPFSRDELVAALKEHARTIGTATALLADAPPPSDEAPWRGRLVAVTGSGGTGASTVAAALAQGFASDPREQGMVLLADLALEAEQAVLHDAADIVPGLPEVVDAHRTGFPPTEDIRAMTFDVVARNYRLLLGLRRHRDWSTLRARSFESALDGLRRTFRLVIADVDSDVEGQAQSGSVDVEERNLLARTTLSAADVVVVVGIPGVKGVHSLVRTIHQLVEHGVDHERIVATVNRSPRSQRARSEITRTVADLVGGQSGAHVVGPIFVGERRGVDDVHRDGARFPDGLTAPLTGAVRAVLDRVDSTEAGAPVPQAVSPGSLGAYAGQEAGSP